MKMMKIYEPAMCCSTGLCGVGVDPELLRIAAVLNNLKQNGIQIQRYHLNRAPMEFAQNKTVCEFLQKSRADKLPFVMVDDPIAIAGRYPTNEEFVKWLELPDGVLRVSYENEGPCCCGVSVLSAGSQTAVNDCVHDDSMKGCCGNDCFK